VELPLKDPPFLLAMEIKFLGRFDLSLCGFQFRFEPPYLLLSHVMEFGVLLT
jgi:hypothetical protein